MMEWIRSSRLPVKNSLFLFLGITEPLQSSAAVSSHRRYQFNGFRKSNRPQNSLQGACRGTRRAQRSRAGLCLMVNTMMVKTRAGQRNNRWLLIEQSQWMAAELAALTDEARSISGAISISGEARSFPGTVSDAGMDATADSRRAALVSGPFTRPEPMKPKTQTLNLARNPKPEPRNLAT